MKEIVMKKNWFKILLMLTALVLMATLAAGCGEDDPEQTEASDEVTEAPAVSLFKLLEDGKIQCKFIKPASATDTEKALVDEIKSGLNKQFKRQITFRDDTTDVSTEDFVVLVGNTSHTESKKAYEALGDRQAVIKIEGNKLIIAFTSLGAGRGVFNSLLDEIAKIEGNVSLSGDINLTYTAKPDSSMLPTDFPGGNVKEIDCGNGSTMRYISDADLEIFTSYCDELVNIGFEKIESHTVGKNTFYTFIGEDEYVYAYYTGVSFAARIISGPIETLGGLNEAPELEEKYTPAMAMIGQVPTTNCGQGYIFRLPDGRLIVQDGGSRYSSRPDYMYEAMLGVAPDPNNIVIAAWFISHPHDDHQRAFEEFVENHAKDSTVKIEQVVYNFGPAEDYEFTRGDGVKETGTKDVQAINNIMRKNLPDTQLVKAHTGQVLNYGSVSVEVLFTVEDLYPAAQFDYINSTSMVIRVNIGGSSVMLLADTTHNSGSKLESMFGSHLESDMVQLAHHGMWASNPSLYNKIKAEVVLWPQVESEAKKWLTDSAIVAALSHAKDLYVSGTGVVMIDFPYEIQNNKKSALS